MRRACLLLGLTVLALIWVGPLLGAYRGSFAAHMLAHMGVVAVAAPLLALGLGNALFSPLTARRRRQADQGQGQTRKLAPPLISPSGTPSSRKRGEENPSSAVRSLPVLASLIELVVVWFWHAPSMRALAQASTMATVIEQASFLAAGLFLWTTCLADGREGGSGQGAAGAFGLLLTSVHMTLLGALLALAPRPLYGAADVTCFGFTLSAGQDQQIGGVVMLLVGAAVYLAGGVSLLARLLADDKPDNPLGRRPAR